MLLKTLFAASLLPILASANWSIDVTYADNAHYKETGHTNSGCTRLRNSKSTVQRVEFHGSTLADTYVLYRDTKCKNQGFKGASGTSNAGNAQYSSYKVY